jgi:hypothetical protein
VDTLLRAFRTGVERFWTHASEMSVAPRSIVERFDVVGHVCNRELSGPAYRTPWSSSVAVSMPRSG